MTETMPLSVLLSLYSDGDERGWSAEFSYLKAEHALGLSTLTESISRDGIREPILLGNDGRVWDGHHRLCIAETLGIEQVPVRHAPALTEAADLAQLPLVSPCHGEALADEVQRWADSREGWNAYQHEMGNRVASELRRLATALTEAEKRRVSSTRPLVSPCHGEPFLVCYGSEAGGSYYSTQVLDSLDCPANGCSNSWDAKMQPSEWNKPKDTTDD